MAELQRPGGELASRPIHFFWVVDCSGSMSYDGKMEVVNNAIEECIPEMAAAADNNPNAQLLIRALQFSSGASWLSAKPVPVEDLFDMWKRKIEWLNKINAQNAQKGKKIQGYLRVNYDLAILLSKYDSYLAWKKKNSTESEGIEKSENILTPETQKILVDKKLNIQETISDKTINIEDIIDEI